MPISEKTKAARVAASTRRREHKLSAIRIGKWHIFRYEYGWIIATDPENSNTFSYYPDFVYCLEHVVRQCHDPVPKNMTEVIKQVDAALDCVRRAKIEVGEIAKSPEMTRLVRIAEDAFGGSIE